MRPVMAQPPSSSARNGGVSSIVRKPPIAQVMRSFSEWSNAITPMLRAGTKTSAKLRSMNVT